MDSGGALDDVRSWPFLAPVSSLGAVVSWEEDDRDGEAQAVLVSYCVANAGGMSVTQKGWENA